MTESAAAAPDSPSLRERAAAGALAAALVLAPVASTKPDLGAAIAVLAAVSLTLIGRRPAPEWAHVPWLAKLGAIVAAWGVLALGFDRMTLAGTPSVVLPVVIAAGVCMCAIGVLGWGRIVGLLNGPLPLAGREEGRTDGR